MTQQIKEWISLYEKEGNAKLTVIEQEEIIDRMQSIEDNLSSEEKDKISDYFGCNMFDY